MGKREFLTTEDAEREEGGRFELKGTLGIGFCTSSVTSSRLREVKANAFNMHLQDTYINANQII